ncbi:unnamed protein product, partial [Polarella glacialis]
REGTLQEELLKHQEAFSKLREEFAAMTAANGSLQKELETAEKEAVLKKQLQEKNASLEQALQKVIVSMREASTNLKAAEAHEVSEVQMTKDQAALELERSLAAAAAEKEAVQKELEMAKDEASQRLQQELSSAEAEKAALLQELKRAKQATSELESGKGEVSQRLQQKLSTLLQELGKAKQAFSELESAKGEELSTAEAEKAALLQELEKAKQAASELESAKGEVSQRLQQELSTAEAEKAALLQELETSKQAASELESAKGEASQRLQQELSAAEAEKAALLQELETSKQAASELESAKGEESQKFDSEKIAFKSRLEAEKQEAVTRLENDLTTFALENDLLQRDILAVKEEAGLELHGVQKQLTSSLKVKAALESQLQEAAQKLKQGLTYAVAAKDESSKQLREGLGKAQAERDALQQQLEDLTKDLAVAEARSNEALTAAGENAKHAASATSEAVKAGQLCRQLESGLQTARSSADTAREEADRLQQALASYSAAAAQMKEDSLAEARRVATGETEAAKVRMMDIGSQMKEQLRAAASRTTAAEAQIGAFQTELAAAKAEREKLDNSQAGLLRELAMVRASASAAEADFQSRLTAAGDEQALRVQLADADVQEAVQLRQRVATLEQWGESVRDHIKGLQKHAQDSEAKADALSAECQAARADTARCREAAKHALVEVRESDKVVKELRGLVSCVQQEKRVLESQLLHR